MFSNKKLLGSQHTMVATVCYLGSTRKYQEIHSCNLFLVLDTREPAWPHLNFQKVQFDTWEW